MIMELNDCSFTIGSSFFFFFLCFFEFDKTGYFITEWRQRSTNEGPNQKTILQSTRVGDIYHFFLILILIKKLY